MSNYKETVNQYNELEDAVSIVNNGQQCAYNLQYELTFTRNSKVNLSQLASKIRETMAGYNFKLEDIAEDCDASNVKPEAVAELACENLFTDIAYEVSQFINKQIEIVSDKSEDTTSDDEPEDTTRVYTKEECLLAKEELVLHGWLEYNIGGHNMVMFKDFVCTDGNIHLVGVDGQSDYGCIYPIDLYTYRNVDKEYDYDAVASTNEHKLLHQFQQDEILYAVDLYKTYLQLQNM